MLAINRYRDRNTVFYQAKNNDSNLYLILGGKKDCNDAHAKMQS